VYPDADDLIVRLFHTPMWIRKHCGSDTVTDRIRSASTNSLFRTYINDGFQKAVPVPGPSPLIASNASSANSLLKPSRLLSLSRFSHSLKFLLFSRCFSSICSINFFLPSSNSVNRFLAAGSSKLGRASPFSLIVGVEAKWLKRCVRGYVVELLLLERKGGGARYGAS